MTLDNRSAFPAVFIRLILVCQTKNATPGQYKWTHVTPVKWSDNYITIWAHEKMVLHVDVGEDAEDPDMLLIQAKNIPETEVPIT